MANTRDTLGDQATLDGLISKTLENFEDDCNIYLEASPFRGNQTIKNVTLSNVKGELISNAFVGSKALESVHMAGISSTIGNYAFNGCEKLVVVDIPNATGTGTSAFNGCSSLETLDFNKKMYFYGGFNETPNLKALILRNSEMSTLQTANSLGGSAISAWKGAVYVPADLVATYRANANWKNYPIADINDYPLTDYSTIKDSWAEIFAAEADGTYSTKYAVGDTKKITINGVDDYMQIVAMDTDDLADESGKAKITWISKGLFAKHAMNSTAINNGGWGSSEMRTWLRETILPTLDATIQNNIKEVTKTYRSQTPNDETLSIADTLWIPSSKEVGFTDSRYVESNGVTYPGVFNTTSRIKYFNGDQTDWFLRSTDGNVRFRTVSSTYGTESFSTASVPLGVALGFCT